MEGEIRGRSGEAFTIDDEFIASAVGAEIPVGSRSIRIRVPSYLDYYILKLLSGRPGDIRDLAALTWQNGVPEHKALIKRTKNVVSEPTRILENMDIAIDEMADERFLDSWRGTFTGLKLAEPDKQKILRGFRALKRSIQDAL